MESIPIRRPPDEPSTKGNGSDAERLEKLREYGLSQYISRAYVALLAQGPSDARSISQSARIPPAKVYGTLTQLMDKGLARAILDSPKRYEPVPFEEYLRSQQQAHLDAAHRFGAAASKPDPLFQRASRPRRSDRGHFAIIRGRRNVIQKVRQLAEGAKKDLTLVLSDGAAQRTRDTRLVLEEASHRGLAPRVLAPPGSRASFRELASFAEFRSKRAFSVADGAVGYGIFDRREVIISHFVPDDASLQVGHDVAIHITEEAIVESLAEVFDMLWNEADVLQRLAARPKKKPSKKKPKKRGGKL